MPVQTCQENGKPGYSWGAGGKCYTYELGDEAGREEARRKAQRQGAAIQAEASKVAKAEATGPTQEELDERYRQVREDSLGVTTEAVNAVLDNADGLARLLAISDDEWAAAEATEGEGA